MTSLRERLTTFYGVAIRKIGEKICALCRTSSGYSVFGMSTGAFFSLNQETYDFL
jgi:hypothetical protein